MEESIEIVKVILKEIMMCIHEKFCVMNIKKNPWHILNEKMTLLLPSFFKKTSRLAQNAQSIAPSASVDVTLEWHARDEHQSAHTTVRPA